MKIKYVRSNAHAKFGLSVCPECGVVVAEEITHTEWHNQARLKELDEWGLN